MSGDYETLEINQPKIRYFQKRSENNTEWLDKLINQIEDMKNNISKSAQWKKKELKELEEFAKENGYNDELKDIFLREVIDRNKEYEWVQIFDQIAME